MKPRYSDHSYRTLVNGGSGPLKTNPLRNLINYQPDIDERYLYTKDLYKPRDQFLINKR